VVVKWFSLPISVLNTTQRNPVAIKRVAYIEQTMADGYRGLIGAVPYAFRRSSSRLFKLYVVIGTLAAVGIAVVVLSGLVVLLGETAESPGGALTLSRSLYVLIGLFLAGPLLAPTLYVARRHRRSIEVSDRYDSMLAVTGFVFLFSLYVGLVITVQPVQQEVVTGVHAPIIGFLYALPQVAGVVPPTIAGIVIYIAHKTLST